MGEYVERLWAPEDAGGLSRKDRAAGRYLAYVPDELGDRLPTLGAAAQGAAEDALAVLARADERIGEGGRHLNHLLIRSESISSSWIEGNRISPKRLAIAELLHEGPQQALDVGGNGRAADHDRGHRGPPARHRAAPCAGATPGAELGRRSRLVAAARRVCAPAGGRGGAAGRRPRSLRHRHRRQPGGAGGDRPRAVRD